MGPRASGDGFVSDVIRDTRGQKNGLLEFRASEKLDYEEAVQWMKEGRKGPEGKGPEGKGPEGKGSEGKGPEGKGPEGKGPEGKGPEGKGPEGKDPEGKDPEGKLRIVLPKPKK